MAARKNRAPAAAGEHPALAAVRAAGAQKVKVAVSDIDGILRGKYLHIDKFAGALDGGFVLPALRVLTDHEIFRRARRLRRPRRYREAAPTAATRALKAGDYVVHLEHGIGIYRGIQTIAVGGEGTLEVAVVVEERHVVPALESLVRPHRHREHLVRGRDEVRAHPERRRDQVPDELPIERVTSDGHTVDTKHVFRSPAARVQ